MWATRFWWMLQSLGFDNASVLDGGLDKWKAEGRALETGPARGLFAGGFHGKTEARIFRRPARGFWPRAKGATPSSSMRLEHNSTKAWSPAVTAGRARIPGSCNVSAATLLDPQTKAFVPLADAEKKFAAQGITKDKRVVAYCGRRYLGHDRSVSCCIGLVTTTSRSMTARWASGPRMPRCRSRQIDGLLVRAVPSTSLRGALRRSNPIVRQARSDGLLRRFAPRNDAGEIRIPISFRVTLKSIRHSGRAKHELMMCNCTSELAPRGGATGMTGCYSRRHVRILHDLRIRLFDEIEPGDHQQRRKTKGNRQACRA